MKEGIDLGKGLHVGRKIYSEEKSGGSISDEGS